MYYRTRLLVGVSVHAQRLERPLMGAETSCQKLRISSSPHTENACVDDLFHYSLSLTASPHAEIPSSFGSSVRSKQVTKGHQKEGKIPRY
jgi:hypothetical protein